MKKHEKTRFFDPLKKHEKTPFFDPLKKHSFFTLHTHKTMKNISPHTKKIL